MRILVPLTYNNYASRVMKWQGDRVTDYADYQCGQPTEPLNFVPGDGINTTAIINSRNYNMTTEPDYLLVADIDGRIVSRWFVMSIKRTTNGQYLLSLRRDVLVDYGAAILRAPAYIMRGHVQDNDPAIFNNEGMHFNQIKTSETPLKDYTGCPWLVAYISPDVSREHPVVGGAIEGYFEDSYGSWDDYPLHNYFGIDNLISASGVGQLEFPIHWELSDRYVEGAITLPLENNKHIGCRVLYQTLKGGTISVPVTPDYFAKPTYSIRLPYNSNATGDLYAQTLQGAVTNRLADAWTNLLRQSIRSSIGTPTETNTYSVSSADWNRLLAENGKIIKVGSHYYQLTLTPTFHLFKNGTNLTDTIRNAVRNVNYDSSAVRSDTGLWLNATKSSSYTGNNLFPDNNIDWAGYTYSFSYVEIKALSTAFKYDFSGKDVSNSESPYGIICMPYADYYKMVSQEGTMETRTMTKQTRLKLMQALGMTNGLLYDIQILPYCPLTSDYLMFDREKSLFRPRSNNTASINVSLATPSGDDTKDYYADADGNPDKNRPNYANWKAGEYLTCMYVALQANISFSIEQSISIVNLKEQSNTDRWRLCSPNFASTFEFNPAKFYDGTSPVIASFDVDMCCRPFSPYIHVNPHFSGLYGDNFHDARGLICSGDFSVDRISDAWETYQYNNKNWESSFNRQIDTMEANKKFQIWDNVINGLAGSISGGITGAAAAGPGGAIIGAAAGVTQGVYNSFESAWQASRNIADTKAQFAYQNENVQAQPYSIQKVSAINNNNKYFPVLEYYTCTTKEKENFRAYLDFFGMSIGRVDIIKSYVVAGRPTFVQAKLLRDVPIKAPTDIYNAINGELNTGVYIYVGRLSDIDDLVASGGNN